MKRSHIVILVIGAVLLIDQALKIYIKTHFHYGESVNMLGLPWAQLKFVENEGMAFGLSWGGITGKYILSIFRIVMAVVLVYFVTQLVKGKEPKGFIAAFSLIIAGAIGNILDSIYFGLIFGKSSYHIKDVAEFMPEGGGYAPFLQGNVVDMFYFPMIKSHYPAWSPIKAGEYFEFFRPIFNVADAAISVGVVIILLFYRKMFMKKPASAVATAMTEASENDPTANSDQA
ncbi:lipoprotein signal peptidase [Saprospiraceae bacterium]|nr:lipoprotein signal peptidase [Saprospiraceae bacterium]